MAGVPATGPPPVLRLAAHPVRWRVMSELARSDRRVGELCDRVGLRQSLVSYHLRLLREGGLVSTRRSAADGRDAYYVLDLGRVGEELSSSGTALHPGLAPAAPGPRRPATPPPRVLFLCTGNSARSQMAEALAERLSGGAVSAASAGTRPKPLHPTAVRVLAVRGVDIADRRSKHVDELSGQHFDFVVTLCDRVREDCAGLAQRPGAIHWSIPDPSRAEGSEGEIRAAFERTADELSTRLAFLIRMIHDPGGDRP